VSQIPRSSARVPDQGLSPARASCMARDVLCYLCYTRRSSFARKSHSINLNSISCHHWLGDIVLLGIYGLRSLHAQASTQTLVVTTQCQCTEEKVEVVGTQRDQVLDRYGRFPGKPAPSPGTAIHPSRPDQGCGPSVCRPQHPWMSNRAPGELGRPILWISPHHQYLQHVNNFRCTPSDRGLRLLTLRRRLCTLYE
jgi:hypothetical protein